jgi:spermidine synthase
MTDAPHKDWIDPYQGNPLYPNGWKTLQMSSIIKPKQIGNFKIDVIEEETQFSPFSKITQLKQVDTNQRIMYDDMHVIIQSSNCILNAKGKVLLTGLGIGMCARALMNKPDVDEITIIEKEADIISLVKPIFKESKKIKIINDDAYIWLPPKGTMYDFAWHDMFGLASFKTLYHMHLITKRFEPYVKEQDCYGKKLTEKGIKSSDPNNAHYYIGVKKFD